MRCNTSCGMVDITMVDITSLIMSNNTNPVQEESSQEECDQKSSKVLVSRNWTRSDNREHLLSLWRGEQKICRPLNAACPDEAIVVTRRINILAVANI